MAIDIILEESNLEFGDLIQIFESSIEIGNAVQSWTPFSLLQHEHSSRVESFSNEKPDP